MLACVRICLGHITAHIDVGRVNIAYPCKLRSHANSDHAPINNATPTTWTALSGRCSFVVIAQSLFEESMSVILALAEIQASCQVRRRHVWSDYEARAVRSISGKLEFRNT